MKLITNTPEYYNDICEEIRLYVPDSGIMLDDRETDDGMIMSVILNEGASFVSTAEFTRDGAHFSYTHETPGVDGDDVVRKRFAKRNIKVAIFRCLRKAYPGRLIPWGSLTGIRPTRLLAEMEKTLGADEAERMMREEFDVTPEKIALAKEINEVQRPFLASSDKNDIGVYIGVPFCRTRCLYCSFASEIRTKKTDMDAYLNALFQDISFGSGMVKDLGLNPRSFYFGGGTPTVLTADELDRLLDKLEASYDMTGKEFTVEAGRPDTITREKLKVLKAHGVTRISVNPQTMCDRTLRLVGRDHKASDIIACFDQARDLGFDSINMDLIAGLPDENEKDMENSLDEITKLSPDCLTVHTLAIKRASRLKEHMSEYALPDVGTVERMVRLGREYASRMGMKPYYMYRQKYMAGNLENVGYSKEGHVCVYNIDMMEDRMSILAHGAGAMTKRVWQDGGRIERVPNPKDIATYIEKLGHTDKERRRLFEL